MTSAVYGDDPTTEMVEGLSPGDVLHFALDGRLAEETATWKGSMHHLKLDLHFGAGSGLTVFPNPVTELTTVQFDLAESGPVRLELLDAAGRLIEVLFEGDCPVGAQRMNGFNMAHLAPGLYSMRMVQGDHQHLNVAFMKR